nr:hypothetical protein [Tanacetum cinerariifolium]
KREGKIGIFNVYELRAVKPDGEKLLRDVTERMNQLTGKGGVAVSHQRMPIRVLNNPNSTIHESSMNVLDGFFGTGSSLGNMNVRRLDGTQSKSQYTILEYPNAEPIINESGNTSNFIPNSLYVILSESASMPNATRVNLVESGVTCDDSPKVCNSSPLVSPSTTFNIPRRPFGIDVAATFGVPP